MVFRVLAEATMTVHFAFLVYVIAGGFLAWRWPRMIWPHLILAGWGFSTIAFGLDCPLTHIENWARREAGEQGLSTGFIDTYLTGVVYPERYTSQLQALAGLVVLASWTGYVVRRRRPRRARVQITAPS
ncbi:DUF2784 domain-containing protein [Rhodococcus sp. NPDC058514]|uniref:DUF2784 domain-containing protein n=1 Tax=unclassified Rhodococcus (in: high G+C Gram-positive bacteria) TaxID=192944 RepID=UPI00364F6E15